MASTNVRPTLSADPRFQYSLTDKGEALMRADHTTDDGQLLTLIRNRGYRCVMVDDLRATDGLPGTPAEVKMQHARIAANIDDRLIDLIASGLVTRFGPIDVPYWSFDQYNPGPCVTAARAWIDARPEEPRNPQQARAFICDASF